jgi:hypothetical protein
MLKIDYLLMASLLPGNHFVPPMGPYHLCGHQQTSCLQIFYDLVTSTELSIVILLPYFRYFETRSSRKN